LADAWNALLIGIADDREPGMARLAAQYPTALLSNTNQLHYDYLEQEFQPLSRHFQHLFLSYEMGSRKPEARCFQAVLDETGFRAEETLFLDDSAGHIAGAEAVGLHTLHLTDYQQLFPLLEARLKA